MAQPSRCYLAGFALSLAACSSSTAGGASKGADAGVDGTSPVDGATSQDAHGEPPSDAHADVVVDAGGAEGSSLAEAGPPALAYMVGIKTNGVPTGPAKVEGWLGRPLDVAGATI